MSKLLKVIVNTLLLLAILSAGALVIPPFAGITTLVSDGMGNTNISRGAVTYAKKTDTSSVATGDKILVDDNSGKYIYTIQSLDIAAGTASVKNVISGDTTEITVRATVSKVIVTIPVIGFLSMAAQSREGIMIIGLAILFLVILFILSEVWKRDEEEEDDEEEEEDEEDPRAELVRRLLEYKMYKYMAQELEEREQEAELLFFKEPTIPREVAKYEEPLDLDKLLDGLTLAKLQKVFDAVMKRNANKLDPVRSRFSTIRREPISLEQKVRSVLSYAREHRHFKFSDVLERESDRLEIVVAFLAVLELMKMGRIHLVQEKLFDEMQLDTVDVDETEGEAELELSTEEGEEYAKIR